MKNLLLIACTLFVLSGFSQTPLKPVTWMVSYVEKSATEGEIVFIANIDKKWHIYSQRPTDVGPIPTSFTVAASANYDLVGKVEEGNAHEEYVSAFDAKVFVFSEKAMFTQKIKRKSNKEFTLQTQLEFMTCNDVQCLPPTTQSFVLNVPTTTASK